MLLSNPKKFSGGFVASCPGAPAAVHSSAAPLTARSRGSPRQGTGMLVASLRVEASAC